MQWEYLREEEFKPMLERTHRVCAMAIGCIEKHGQHLPLGTDTLKGGRILEMASEREEVCVFPKLFLGDLQDFINKRKEEMPEGSYTTSLFTKGVNKIAQKVGEEALETVIEATNGTNDHLVYEASDLLYHLLVLLTEKGLRIEDVASELQQRHDPNWDKQRREAKAKGEMK